MLSPFIEATPSLVNPNYKLGSAHTVFGISPVTRTFSREETGPIPCLKSLPPYEAHNPLKVLKIALHHLAL